VVGGSVSYPTFDPTFMILQNVMCMPLTLVEVLRGLGRCITSHTKTLALLERVWEREQKRIEKRGFPV
jgi:hypothetical protein